MIKPIKYYVAGTSLRYCLICKEYTTFIKDPNKSHSECNVCGNSQSKYKKPGK